MEANCYVLIDPDSRQALVIDPGEEAQYIAEQLRLLHAVPCTILATHGHFDHILAAFELQMIFHIPFRLHEADTFLVKRMRESAEHFLGRAVVEPPPKVSAPLSDKEKITVGRYELTVCHTPGHTPGSVCFYAKKQHVIFVGDTIFSQGGVGRTDFSYSDAKKLNDSIRTILSFPNNTIIYPGHGDETTVIQEKQYHSRI